MQKSFKINSSTGSYAVLVGQSILKDIAESNKDSLFIIDDNLRSYIPKYVEKIIYIKANEKSKSRECIPNYIKKMKEYNINRKSHIYAIGGGVIQDIATFSSSIYMRGISWSYFPTTVLGMVDSCIGGKSAINLENKKNLVGNFFPPKNIYIDLEFIKTLAIDHTIGGIFEASKICYAKGEDEFNKFIDIINNSISTNPVKIYTKIDFYLMILLSLESKKWFIETDEFDQKERLLLNFGHTFGHAFESATNYKISHGISVGFGMAVAIEVSVAMGLLNDEGINYTNKMNVFLKNTFLTIKDMKEIKVKSFNYELYLEAFNNDKKHLADQYRVILPCDNGNLRLISLEKNKEVQKIFISASEKYIKNFNFIEN